MTAYSTENHVFEIYRIKFGQTTVNNFECSKCGMSKNHVIHDWGEGSNSVFIAELLQQVEDLEASVYEMTEGMRTFVEGE